MDQALAVLKVLGIPWSNRGDIEGLGDGITWDGSSIGVQACIIDVFHDIGHWIVAAPERRTDPFFGLPNLMESQEQSDEEESLASLMGLLLMRHMGLEWRDYWEEQWHGQGWSVRYWLKLLRSRGLIVGLTPVPWPHRRTHSGLPVRPKNFPLKTLKEVTVRIPRMTDEEAEKADAGITAAGWMDSRFQTMASRVRADWFRARETEKKKAQEVQHMKERGALR